MKLPLFLLAFFTSLQLHAAVVSSIQRLDAGGSGDLLVHSTNPQFPTFHSGSPVWGNFSFTYRSTPNYLLGADAIKPLYRIGSNLDPDYQLRITLDVAARLYLLVDDRMTDVAAGLPWLAGLGFVDTGDEAAIQISGDNLLTTASIYTAVFAAGDVVLLQQNNTTPSGGMYTVGAVAVPEASTVAFYGVLGAVAAGMGGRRLLLRSRR